MRYVYKSDGTRQCENLTPVSQDDARKELEQIIGADKILEFFTIHRLMEQLCGLPTGTFYVAKLTDAGYDLLKGGFRGPHGWSLWVSKMDPHTLEPGAGDPPVTTNELSVDDDSGSKISDLVTHLASAVNSAGSVKDLIGYKLRVIHPGQAITMDYYLKRVNIFVDDGGVITGITYH